MTETRSEALGRLVRETWVAWAREQPDPKPSWLVPWGDLDTGQREVDTRIGEALAAAIGAESARPVDLAGIAHDIQAALRENRANGLTDGNALDVTALTVAEEAGELIGAYRRWTGHARRSGTREELAAEVADVLIVTAIFAELAGIDIDTAVRAKVAVIFSRGWKEPADA